MLRCPDIPPEPDRFGRWNGPALLVVLALTLGLLAAVQLSPVGTLFGVVASFFIMLLGMVTGWIVTHVLRIPRDARGVHQRTAFDRDERGE